MGTEGQSVLTLRACLITAIQKENLLLQIYLCWLPETPLFPTWLTFCLAPTIAWMDYKGPYSKFYFMHYAPESFKMWGTGLTVEIWSFYRHSDFTWNQILAISNALKMSFLAILEAWILIFSKFEQLSSPKFTKNSKFRVSEIAKNDIFGPFEFTKIWFHVKSEWQYNDQLSSK